MPAQAPAVLQAYGDLGGATALGRRDVRLDALPHRAAYYEIVDERTGRVLRKGAVPQGGWPDAGDWRPMELMAAVGPAGLVRSPSLVEGSGVDAVDAFALDYLVRGLRVGALMPPGFYRIRLGP